jgi:hypothetical protein
LVKRGSGANEEVLAKGVLSFDLCADSAVVYTNGTGIFVRKVDGGTEKLGEDKVIEQVRVVE